jgi:serine/threonine protein phosphatase PrpC
MRIGSATLRVQAGIATGQGSRDRNEDFVACLLPEAGRPALVAAVADGVGGGRDARVAAETAVRLFLDAMDALSPLRGVKANAVTALDALNRWVHAQGSHDRGMVDPALPGMACSFTGLVLRGRQMHLMHVGNARLYRLREGVLARLTTDHVSPRSPVRRMATRPGPTRPGPTKPGPTKPGPTEPGPTRAVGLTRAVGAEAALRVDYVAEASRLHDRYLLCTHGVHGALSDRAIGEALNRRDAASQTARVLVAAALQGRVGDSATALVVDVVGLPEADQADLEAAVEALPIIPPPRSEAAIDGYTLGRMLADGRYSRVFRATRDGDRREVVMKFPKLAADAEPAPGASFVRQSFLREAWIAARLHSPWIAEVFDAAGETRSALYTVMPFYPGETLEQRLLRRPAVTRTEGIGIAVNLAKAVASLHRAGVVHRDIKPENVILQAGGGLKLIDLGVARLPNLEDFPADSVPGTPSYMAPELIAGQPGDEKSDLFALGVTLFRMFTGSFPYGEIEAFSHPRFTRPPASIAALRPDLPAWLDAVLLGLIAVRPADRFDDALECVFALEHGALQATPAPLPRLPLPRLPLIERDPLRFWQTVSAVLALLLLLLALWR